MNPDDLIKYGAAAAAIALLVAPYFPAIAKWATALLGSVRPASPAIDDMAIILDLAKRLRDEGNAEAVALCQQLIDVMLAPPKPKK